MAYRTTVHKNPDKAGHSPSCDGILPAHPFRWGLFSGGPGRGKRNLVLCVLHHLMTKDARYDTISVIHLDKTTKEYEILEDSAPVFRLVTIEEDGVPDPEMWNPDERNLLIIDEINHGGLTRAETGALSRLFGYASTHKNLSIILQAQCAFETSPQIRRYLNMVTLWDQGIKQTEGLYSRLVGEPLGKYFRLCGSKYDSVTLDFSQDGPRFRLNFFTKIDT